MYASSPPANSTFVVLCILRDTKQFSSKESKATDNAGEENLGKGLAPHQEVEELMVIIQTEEVFLAEKLRGNWRGESDRNWLVATPHGD